MQKTYQTMLTGFDECECCLTALMSSQPNGRIEWYRHLTVRRSKYGQRQENRDYVNIWLYITAWHAIMRCCTDIRYEVITIFNMIVLLQNTLEFIKCHVALDDQVVVEVGQPIRHSYRYQQATEPVCRSPFTAASIVPWWQSVMECLPWDLFLGHVYDSIGSRTTVGWS